MEGVDRLRNAEGEAGGREFCDRRSGRAAGSSALRRGGTPTQPIRSASKVAKGCARLAVEALQASFAG